MKIYLFKKFLLSFILLVSFRPSIADPVNMFIQSVSPGMNSVSVNRSSDINIVFTQHMMASTLNSSNVIVNGVYSGVISSNINYNAALRKLTVDPLTEFKAGEKILVTLKSGIKTENNIPINPFIYSFIGEVTGSTNNYQISDIISNCENVEPGDIDRDGDIDLITSFEASGIRIYKNNGSGFFSYYSQISGGTSPFILNDFDLDGDLDIVYGASDVTIRFYSNDGTGIFSFSLSTPGRLAKETGDFDGDGDIDMAAILSGFDMSIFRNNNGTFTETATIPVPHECNDPQWYSFSDYEIDDIDGDGDLDIVEVHHTSWEILGIFIGCMYLEFFKNDGAGNFIKETITSGGIGGNHNLLDQHYITPFNYDGDNDEDILLYDTKLTNIGNGLFDISGSIWNIGKPNTFDIDGDRDLDFITLNFYAGIYKNDGSGNFQREPGSFLEDWMEKLTSADLDNDGDLDMVTVKNNTLRTYMNNESPCISGPELIVTNSVNLYYTEPSSEVYWDISNFESTQATIISNNHNDSIYVNAGNNFGHFVLYLIMTDSILCTKHVYIDNPAPVEISAFNSSVSRSDVSLLWSTSSEINNSGFEIEKTNVTGQTTNEWSKVGFVSGGGTTNEMREYSFTDRNLTTGKYKYRLKQLDFNGNFEYYELSEEVSIGIPDKYDLSQNYPNPFNPVTTINYDLPTDGIVTIKVFDLLGREIKTLVNEMKNAGYYKLTFNASDLSSGAYFYRMTSEDFVSVKKFVVLK